MSVLRDPAWHLRPAQPADGCRCVTEHAYARISPKWWPSNPGGVLVIPREHHENLYTVPSLVGHDVWDLTQRVAIAMRNTYDCDGVSTRQHNEPAGDQDVWHLHVHVLPRHHDDRLYERHRESRWVSTEDRARFADALAESLGTGRRFS